MINELVKQAHENAIEKGWWEEDRSFGELIALIHSEASEALEDYRKGSDPTDVWYEYSDMHLDISELDGEIGKPCGIPSELADVCIRIFDMCGRYGIDLEKAIKEKMTYNATRSRKHGGKVI